MTIEEDSRTFKCPNCGNMKRKVARSRYIPCDNEKCQKVGYEMKWVDDETR